MSSSTETIFLPPSTLLTFATSLLTAHNVPSASATHIADCLLAADLAGHDTHGLLRLPAYIAQMTRGTLSASTEPVVTRKTPVVALVEGNNGFGFLAAAAGMDVCCEAAGELGIGMASVRGSNHFGMSAWVVRRAVERGFVALVFTNSSPAMPAWGGSGQVLGVSPLAAGAPGSPDFVLDMAPSVAARGKVHKALRRGEKIPAEWGIDRDGRRTEDPAAVLDGGSMLPMGGPKGSGLSIMMDVFSGVLSGSAFAGGVCGPYDGSREADVGHFLVAIKPGLFVGEEEFRERMKVLYESVTGGPKMEGVDRIYFPGEIEAEREKERREEGVPYTKGEIGKLNEEARKVGIEELPYA